jgi:hypothetical protein
MKPEDKAVVQQALEFLEMISPQFPPLVYTETDRKRDEASTALRQLLEQPEPVQEPIYQMQMMDGKWIDQAKQSYEYNKAHGNTVRIVYTTPPAQPSTDHSEQHLDMVDHGDELTIAYLDGVHTGKRLVKPDYAWPTVQDYEREVGYEVNDTFKGAWAMARTTKDMLEQMSGGTP